MNPFEIHHRKVLFFQVRTPKEKMDAIIETATQHFRKKEKFLIVVEDLKAEIYVDELLWKNPAASFLPHRACDTRTEEWIAITHTKQNVNEAKIAFNLCSTPLLLEGPLGLIYDFEDLTSSSKQKLSALRFDSYRQNHFMIISRS